MIAGIVLDRQSFIVGSIIGPTNKQADIEFVIDTGFTGTVVVPESLCISLGLPIIGRKLSTMANGLDDWANLYTGVVDWNGTPVNMEITAMGREALIGMTALLGNELCIQIAEGGDVSIVPL